MASPALLGQRVTTYGLSARELNGLSGVVVRIQGDRVVVSLPHPHGEKALRPQNLEVDVHGGQQHGGTPHGGGRAGAAHAGGYSLGGAMLEVRRRWIELGPQLQFACAAVLMFLIYWLFFSGRSRHHHHDYGYDDYHGGYGYDDGYYSGGWGLPSIGTIGVLALMYYGHRQGMSPFQLLMLYNLLGGGGFGGRRRRHW
eukprot:TRINITY_DN12597_c0_g1_i1.p1 TRINITY_DN12597_c0_g1~~TRINITY_DN12597_c0_g1_i1.p1  ORF type:complete len:227 (+),score=77.52 TRINITY_DN12597_c0_g1_i1:89-682(+)